MNKRTVSLTWYFQLVMTSALFWFATWSHAGVTLTTLASFSGSERPAPGASPHCALLWGADGLLYGTTAAGGTSNLGTIFRIAPDGSFDSLLSFDGTNGAGPSAGLISDADGNFYGTTYSGGSSNLGTVFRLTSKGSLKTLFSFTGTNTAFYGANPSAAFARNFDGTLVGTASYGGSPNRSYDGVGYGTIFQLSTNQIVTVPFKFNNANGARPSSALTLANDGCLYGTTAWGGILAGQIFPGFGTIFRIAPDGTVTTIYRFSGGDDGGFPYAGLVQGRDGCLYGAAFNGGAHSYGTLFKITTNGSFTLFHTFDYFESGSPHGGLIEGSDGNFYGTTYGLFAGLGSIYRITPAGQFTTLAFFNGANGARPDASLLQGPDGNFYGTTSEGGASGLGTVFRLSVPLQPTLEAMLTNHSILLSWHTVVGQSYQVQCSTDLTRSNWSNLGDAIVATNTVLTASDPLRFDAPRIYRVVLP